MDTTRFNLTAISKHLLIKHEKNQRSRNHRSPGQSDSSILERGQEKARQPLIGLKRAQHPSSAEVKGRAGSVRGCHRVQSHSHEHHACPETAAGPLGRGRESRRKAGEPQRRPTPGPTSFGQTGAVTAVACLVGGCYQRLGEAGVGEKGAVGGAASAGPVAGEVTLVL